MCPLLYQNEKTAKDFVQIFCEMAHLGTVQGGVQLCPISVSS